MLEMILFVFIYPPCDDLWHNSWTIDAAAAQSAGEHNRDQQGVMYIHVQDIMLHINYFVLLNIFLIAIVNKFLSHDQEVDFFFFALIS